MERMLDEKQIRGIFLFKFKMRRKGVATTWHINNTFGPGTANKRTVQWWFKKFCKGDKSLENDECSGWSSLVVIYNPLFVAHHNPIEKWFTVA